MLQVFRLLLKLLDACDEEIFCCHVRVIGVEHEGCFCQIKGKEGFCTVQKEVRRVACLSANRDSVSEEGVMDELRPFVNVAFAHFDQSFSDGEVAAFNHSIGAGVIRRDGDLGNAVLYQKLSEGLLNFRAVVGGDLIDHAISAENFFPEEIGDGV